MDYTSKNAVRNIFVLAFRFLDLKSFPGRMSPVLKDIEIYLISL